MERSSHALMAQATAQGDVGEDVGIYICADSVDGLLERFIEYEQAQTSNGETHENPSSTTCQQSSVTNSNKSLPNKEVSPPRKRHSDSALVSPTKKRCTPKAVSLGKAKGGPTLKDFLSKPLSEAAAMRHMDVYETDTSVGDAIPHNRPKTREAMIEIQQSRRIVFLGNLPPPVTEMLIFEYFRSFGELEDISLHTKKPDQKYAFVTYKDRSAADKAIADGFLPGVPNLYLCYGGRRHFCGRAYIDFDSHQGSSSGADFDSLLKDCAKRRP